MRLVFTGIALLMCFAAFAQRITIKKVELAGDKINVYYDLDDSNPNNEYLLHLYTSTDNFSNAVTKVSGDVGPGITPGINKKIVWSIRDEFGGYKGKIALEVRGRVYIPFMKFDNSSVAKSYKRGRQYLFSWKSGDPTGQVNLTLMRGDELVQNVGTLSNNGNYNLLIPPNAKPGGNYKLRFTNANNAEEILETPTFKVAPKVPLAVKVLPILAVGGAAAALSGGGGGGGNTPPDNNSTEIPVPDLPN